MRCQYRRFIAVLLIAGMACRQSTTEPALLVNAVAIAPMPQYALWWRLVERCAGRSGDLSAIHWYIVPGANTLGQNDVQGMYYPATQRIVLAERYARTGSLVRHEMLHALVPEGEHPAEYFQQRCGGVVDCSDVCVRDGGPTPSVDSTGPVVTVDILTLSARADSTAPSLARDSGWVALTIEVGNPHAYAVRLRLRPLSPGYFVSATYGYRLSYCDGSPQGDPTYLWQTDSTLVLGPNQVQRHVFDFQVWSICTEVRPFFNDDSLSTIRLEPTP
jgi:hypothetical protein